jgi:hypothetical protein
MVDNGLADIAVNNRPSGAQKGPRETGHQARIKLYAVEAPAFRPATIRSV